MSGRPGVAVWVLLALATAQPATAEHALTMWQVDGAANRVYLLGSLHLLRPGDYPLPARIDAAYADADKLVLELDLDDLDPVTTVVLVKRLGMLPAGTMLADIIGTDAWAEVQAIAARLDIPLGMLESAEPWLAAVTVEQLVLARLGFEADFGVENYLLAEAGEDGKEVIGLESLEGQLGFLDGLSADAQRALLLQTLTDSAELEASMNDLVDAWRHGQVDVLEAAMLDDMREDSELYQQLVVTRNRAWSGQIAEFLRDDDDYLVVVGALHLVGPDGLPAMLRARGFATVQLREE